MGAAGGTVVTVFVFLPLPLPLAFFDMAVRNVASNSKREENVREWHT